MYKLEVVPIRDSSIREQPRRDFIALAGKGLGLAALSSATLVSLLKKVEAATTTVAHLTPEEAAMNEDYWAAIQKSFTVTRGIINLNNGGVSPGPRIVTEALIRYQWQQEDATAVVKYLFDKRRIFTVAINHEEFQGIRITPKVYTTIKELDRFCEQMETIARKGLPA